MRVLGKGNKKRVMPLPPEITDVPRKVCATGKTAHQFLFPVRFCGPPAGTDHDTRRTALPVPFIIASRSRVPQANAHRLRPTLGADMVRAGISLPALQRLMGHSQIHTTMLYVQLAPQDVWREYAHAIENRTRLSPRPIP